jgi:hypothetical protein
MRTTLTLEPDVVKLLQDEQYRTKKTFKEVLNSAVRSSLRRTPTKRPTLLPPRAMGLRTGIDPRDLVGLADELEAESYLRTASRRRR